MDASRLKEIIDALLKKEQEFAVNTKLKAVNAALAQLASSPQDKNAQSTFANNLSALRDTLSALRSTFTPAEIKLIEQIGGSSHFVNDLAATIEDWARANPITPTVAQQKVDTLYKERTAYLQTLTALSNELAKVNIYPDALEPGEAEVGFLIPRLLFNNHLDELIKELGVINRILRAFSEVATGSAEPVEVRQISTSDPLFSFGLDPVTVATVGAVIAWALSQWKKVEEIRTLRSETEKNAAFSKDDIKDFFDTKIEKTIGTAIEQKVEELVSNEKKIGRQNEQRNALTWALQSILARVERGMTVEVRFLPPVIDTAATPPKQQEAFATLAQVAPQLVFPKTERSPVLEIPPPEPVPARKPAGKDQT
jgi:hypothetical protein